MKHKAKAIEKYYGKYFTEIVYEYRGNKYEVEYANGQGICVTPAWIQHRDAQEEIDKFLDNPKPPEKKKTREEIEREFDLVYEMLTYPDF